MTTGDRLLGTVCWLCFAWAIEQAIYQPSHYHLFIVCLYPIAYALGHLWRRTP